MSTMGLQIREKRLKMDMTLDVLSAKTKISKPYLSLIENGKTPHPPAESKLRRLEQVLQFPNGHLIALAQLKRTPRHIRAVLSELLKNRAPTPPGKKGQAVDLDQLYISGELRELAERAGGNLELVDTSTIPIINKVSAGYPKDFTDLSYPRGVADAYLSCPGLNDRDAFAARVSGDSMTPRYNEGDIVVFSPAAPMRDGDDCFVRFADGNTTFKRAFTENDEDGKPVVRLQPRNGRYRPQSIPADHVTGLYKAVFKFQKIENE
jgi:repressor LexA